jgi:AcrR family transcriptional regulator/DNA-binding MarR family transcriptional regulator
VSEIQRARILGAAVEVVTERGAGEATVARVVARAGMSRRTFYELFDDREDCFLAAFDQAVARAAASVLPAYEARGSWRERARAGLLALLCFLEEEPSAGALLVVEALGAGPRALQRRAEVLDALIAAVDEGHAEAHDGLEVPPLTAEGVVGAVFSVIHSRMIERGAGSHLGARHQRAVRAGSSSALRGARASREDVLGSSGSLVGLLNPLMSMIVAPYLGARAARKELQRPAPEPRQHRGGERRDPLKDLDMRLTYRTVCVLSAIAENPGESNRQVGEHAGVHDQGQMSKLLARLEHLGLIENTGPGHARGETNAWTLTSRGRQVERTIRTEATG